MIGDVNLFLKGVPADEDFEVEAEIMIAGASHLPPSSNHKLTRGAHTRPCFSPPFLGSAEPAYRRRGVAYTALQLMFSYATDPSSPSPLPVPKDRLVARIGEKNAASIRLFEKLGFTVTKRVAVFEEVELRFTAGDEKTWTAGSRKTLAV